MNTYFSKLAGAACAVLCAGAMTSGTAAAATAVKATAKAAAVTGTIDPVSGIQTLSGTIKYTYPKVNGTVVPTPDGATFYTATITVNGVVRSYDVMRPNPAPASAPMLLLLHPNGTSAEAMTNLTEVAPFLATQGFWAVMPSAQNGKWNDDPSNSGDDDVQFISALISTLTTQGVDASRVYAAGYSNGGFMSERLACQLSSKIAGFVAVAATLRNSLATAAQCTPSHVMPVAFIDGTSDLVVPYNGEPSVQSAAAATAFWAVKNGCTATAVTTTTLPQTTKDGTTVAQTSFTACPAGSAVDLYTVNGGGHTWPGSPYSVYTAYLGKTSQNLDATLALWQFLTPYSLK